MFENADTLDELKRIYRKLCKHLHPDLGGDKELMQLATEEYENKKLKLENNYDYKKAEEEWFKNNKYSKIEDVIQEFKKLSNLENFMKPNEKEFFYGVVTYAEKNGYVTEKQLTSLQGMLVRLTMREKSSKD